MEERYIDTGRCTHLIPGSEKCNHLSSHSTAGHDVVGLYGPQPPYIPLLHLSPSPCSLSFCLPFMDLPLSLEHSVILHALEHNHRPAPVLPLIPVMSKTPARQVRAHLFSTAWTFLWAEGRQLMTCTTHLQGPSQYSNVPSQLSRALVIMRVPCMQD